MSSQRTLAAAVLAAGLALPAAAGAAPLPQPVADMIAAAADDPATLKAVVAMAKKTNPDSVAEIDAQVKGLADRAEAARVAKLESQGFLEGWKGEGELGLDVSTGNVSERGFTAGLGFAKETLRWRHAFDFDANYRRTEGVTTAERYFGGYNGRYKFSERFYAVGVLSAEKDTFAGFNSRFTEGLGLGYVVVDRPDLKFSIEGGPALRQTDYEDGDNDSTIAARIAGDLAWTIREGTVFTQTASGYFESSNATLAATTAITTKLAGALAARASFDVRHETDPPAGREKTDTTTRVTLVYSF